MTIGDIALWYAVWACAFAGMDLILGKKINWNILYGGLAFGALVAINVAFPA